MAYPRLLNLDVDTKARLSQYIDTEISNHYIERGSFLDDLERWQKDYWAKPVTEAATFPFNNAATIVIPLSAIAIEAVHARTMTTLFALNQFVSARAATDRWSNVARPLEKFLDRALLEDARMYDKMNSIVLEIVKFGTGTAKVGYEKITKTAIREVNGIEQEFNVVIKDGATVDALPVSRFLMPFSATEIRNAHWKGEEHVSSPHEIEQMIRDGLFYDDVMDDLKGWVTRSNTSPDTNRTTETQEQLENRSPILPSRINWIELWMTFDTDSAHEPFNADGSGGELRVGEQREIVVYYHKDSGTFLGIRYNWKTDLSSPYHKGVYFPVEHRWAGIGVCKQNEQFQKEITTQHRQRLDNATLANMRMIKISKLSGYGPNEPVFPGKMWFVDDPRHVETFQLGEIYPSSYNNEQGTLIYSQQRTGISEVQLGMPQMGTPGTATSDLARIQEGNKKFDFIYRNIKELTNDIIVDFAANIQQFGSRQLSFLDDSNPAQGLVRSLFTMPTESIREGLIFELRAAGQQENKIVDRQNWVQVAGLLTQYYTNLLQLSQGLGDQEATARIAKQGMIAGTEAMRQILESFDIRNVDKIIVKEYEQMMQQAIGGGNVIGANGAGIGGPQTAIPPAGMGGLAALMSQIGGGVPQ